jgi:2-polyprenyl-3-methyl-5-hydroxy-6-metoxy-1,4-benzoquinol methylase
MTFLEHADGRVAIEELPGGRRSVRVKPRDPAAFIRQPACETAYPVGLIESLLQIKGLAWLCDEISRDESPSYVQLSLQYAVLGYVAASELKRKRLLDFGCGCGSSTMVLARMFPDLEIVGVDLEPDFVSVAQLRARHYRLKNVTFMVSPNSDSLPNDLGSFDFVVLSAVWEHLLPAERAKVSEQLWHVLKCEGVLFVSQIPHRWYPIEAHTTGLPLLNYIPRRVAHWLAIRFSPRVAASESWETLLRRGIRGGTDREVLSALRATGEGRPTLMSPAALGIGSCVELWYRYSQQLQPMKIKAVMWRLFNVISVLTGSAFAPGLDLAIKKRCPGSGPPTAVPTSEA